MLQLVEFIFPRLRERLRLWTGRVVKSLPFRQLKEQTELELTIAVERELKDETRTRQGVILLKK